MKNKKITLLTDYLGRFGSRHGDTPYRSGMDKKRLAEHFTRLGWEAVFRPFSAVDFSGTDHRGKVYLYTSSEDRGYHYKDYLEDVIYGLELAGARVVPPYKYLRASNNKVMMEILRETIGGGKVNSLRAWSFGTLENLKEQIDRLSFPCVLKTAAGASGRGVFLAGTPRELIRKARRISRTRYPAFELWDRGRALRHQGYRRESRHRRRFIVQEFIPGLQNDWKVYFFGSRLYVFYRPILKGRGIRASGGGYHNYRYGREAGAPEGLFDFARDVFEQLDLPHASLDIIHDGRRFHLLEFQALYFGTAGVLLSDHYFEKRDDQWRAVKNPRDIEGIYAQSVVEYITHDG